ncbi:RND transporter [Pacificimonas flava]|uniref:RND transporter n=2 Tax=Pacificimonas TaxID=1960290 RepID=A0A219B1G9_9SPHN|nr:MULTISPECIES: efflux transporter outer membrane subunit [Pacificimonas]MBZ6379597.1 efflux transporter outer membrane subunit [Pacificimonas aurantium]OWV31973.1 RND transporter [Pacificimonas flava]
MRKITLIASLLLGGCINLAPEHQAPDLPTAAEYDAAYRPETGGPLASEIAWRDFFGDERLEALIAAALDNNRDLVQATGRIAEARAAFRVQRAERLPEVGASGSAIRSRTPIGSSALGAVTTNQGEDADDGETVDAPAAVTVTNYDLSVGVSSFELDFWGRVRNLSDAALARYLSTVAAERAFRLSLVGDVASAYFTLLEADERISLAEATLESRQEELRIARLRLESGITSALDFRQADALVTQAQTELSALQLSRAETRNLLAVLVGGPVAGDLPPGHSLEEQDLVTTIDAGMPSTLLLARPDVIAAEYDLQAARFDIGAARAAFFPTISLTGTAGFASTELDNLVGDDGFSWRFGPSIDLPLFDWGRREANLDVAEARELIQVAAYERAIQTAFREVSDALARRRWLAEQVEAQERNVAALDAISRLARLRYREGAARYLEVLDAERNLFAARQNLIVIERQLAEAHVALYVALGGGGGFSVPAPPAATAEGS